MVSTHRPSTITPVHRSCSRPPSDTRNPLSRVDSPSSATACPEGSTGRSGLCRRSEGSRTRHGPHERTSEPKAHARPSMWRPCSPDGEVCIGPRPPLRDPGPYLAKTDFPLEVTLGTFFLHGAGMCHSHVCINGMSDADIYYVNIYYVNDEPSGQAVADDGVRVDARGRISGVGRRSGP